MLFKFRSCVSSILAVSLFLATPAPLFAASAPASSAPVSENIDPKDAAQTSNDMQLLYWGEMQETNPILAEFALGGPSDETPLWKVEDGNPLLDSDPFFMRAQTWQASGAAASDCEAGSVCFMKENSGAVSFSFEGRTLTLNQPLTPILETDTHILLSADDLSLFQAKAPGEVEPGEGLFFINKADFPRAAKYNSAVPVYYFALPGAGWTGPNPYAFENAVARQLVIYNHDKFGLPIDQTDLETIEHVEFQNLTLAQTWSVLENQVAENGVALPKPNTTLAFGMFFSGQLPQAKSDFASNSAAVEALTKIAAKMKSAILPSAEAREPQLSYLQRMTQAYKDRKLEIEATRPVPEEQLQLPMDLPDQAAPKSGVVDRVVGWTKGVYGKARTAFFNRQTVINSPELYLQPPAKPVDPDARPAWRRWLVPGIMYGTKFGIAAAIAPHIDWSSLITADMPTRIMNVSMLFGGVLAASIALKYTIHKARFDKKYPKTPDETALQRLNKEHKGILDEYTHGLWAATAMTPQWIRHNLDFMKDRFLPANQIVHKGWEATMGFQMRASSRLAMNWKTFYLGSIVFGMADSIQVVVDMLIFGPLLIHMFGGTLGGVTTAAFVSATILSQFVGYLREGAHSYSADVKMIHMKSAEDEAKRLMRTQGFDPEAPKNDGMRLKLTAVELEKRYKMVGLPGKDEFLYDPITMLEGMIKKSGYTLPEELSEADRAKLAGKDFVLSRRRWGLVKPALKRALEAARLAQTQAPSETGAKVVQLLNWAINNRGNLSAMAGRAWDASSSQWGAEELQESMHQALVEDLKTEKAPTGYKAIKSALRGAFKYLGRDSTREARDIRSVLYLMSTSGSPLDVAPYLPQSWKDKAGSEEVSLLGAELFHRAFYSYLEFNEDKVKPSADLEAEFGARAQKIMARIDRRNPDLLRDPFARQVRYGELMSRLQRKDEERKAVMEYDPAAPKDGRSYTLPEELNNSFERMQWDIARELAAKRLNDIDDTDTQVTREWMGMAELYRVKTDDGTRTGELDLSDWARTYKFRTIVAQEISKRVGLYVEDPEQSRLVQKVVVQAAVATESQLASPNEQFYRGRLSEEDRKFYEAEIFSRQFINTYVDMAVRSDVKDGDGVKATSPEYPGRFQAKRQMLIGRPFGKIRSAGWRVFESFFRNEESSYSPTLWGWMDRNIPLVPDLVKNASRLFRFMPYAFLIGWPTSYYIWQLHIPYVMYIVTFALAFIHPTLVEINNRIMRNFDIKPMDDVPSKLTYAFIHSTLTNPQAVAEAAFSQSIVGTVDGVISDCEEWLSGGPTPLLETPETVR